MKGLEAAAAQRQKRASGAFLAAEVSCQAALCSAEHQQGDADGRNLSPIIPKWRCFFVVLGAKGVEYCKTLPKRIKYNGRNIKVVVF
ncbi:MAG TPA: hypothetical protein PKB13_11385 [Clostridia bacterium]|nr:hypothetical protein [Clostridia bacterium]